MTREQAINYLFSCGFTNEQVGDVVRALTYEPTTKNDCEHCSKTYGTLGCCDTVNNEWVYSCKEGHEEYAKGIRKFGSTTKKDSSGLEKNSKKLEKGITKNDLRVEEVTALAEWTEKLTKASEDAYNKGYADGVKSVNICPHCGEYIGEEE